MENEMLRSVAINISRSVESHETIIDQHGDLILPEETNVQVAPMEISAMGVDEKTTEEVVRNLLNVSNELTGISPATPKADEAPTAPTVLEAPMDPDVNIKIALNRLRDKSRVMAQAIEMQQRQVRRFSLFPLSLPMKRNAC
jgi:hypothetical protein